MPIRAFSHPADLRGEWAPRRHHRLRHSARRTRLGIQAISYDDDVHPYSDLVIGRLMPCCSTTSSLSAAGALRIYHPAESVAVATTSVCWRPECRFGTRSTKFSGAMRTAPSSEFSASGRLERRSAGALRPGSRREPCRRSSARCHRRPGALVGSGARYLPSLLRVVDHHRAIVPVHGTCGRARRGDRKRTRVRSRLTRASDRLREIMRHADLLQLFVLLWDRGAFACRLSQRRYWVGAQLRGLRKRDLSRRAGSGAHRPARGGPDPWRASARS
jgi:hypothetical protein